MYIVLWHLWNLLIICKIYLNPLFPCFLMEVEHKASYCSKTKDFINSKSAWGQSPHANLHIWCTVHTCENCKKFVKLTLIVHVDKFLIHCYARKCLCMFFIGPVSWNSAVWNYIIQLLSLLAPFPKIDRWFSTISHWSPPALQVSI